MRYKLTKEQLEAAVSASYSKAEVLRKLGVVVAGGNYATLDKYLKLWDIDTAHFRGKGWNVGLRFKPKPAQPLAEILVKGSYYQSNKLRKRLLAEGFKAHRCESCQLVEWLGQPIALELHHVDGDKTNNCLENLQLLCPNCHAATDNYRGRNIGLPGGKPSE